jgi:ribosomal protein S10
MAKIYISFDSEFADVADRIEKYLRKNSGHRRALYEEQSDFTIHLSSNWAAGDEKLTPLLSDNNKQLNDIGKEICKNFEESNIPVNYPKNKGTKKEYPTLQLNLGRQNTAFDREQWSELIAEGIIKYFNPDYVQFKKSQKEPLVKRSQDKTYYDRAFNNNPTNNSSILSRKK